jgi:hypothetical protein
MNVQNDALLSAMPPRTGCCEGTMIINTWSLTAAALFNPYAC